MAALYDSLNAMFTQIATDVKALFSGKVNKSGDTLTGNLVVNTPVESKVSVAATGKPDTQLYANANTCGLYALDAGFFTHYDRVANKKYVWGVDFGTVVLNNAGTYGINISGSASAFNGQAASYYTDIPSRLGYTPVQQGTGVGQGTNAIKIGWSAGTAKLKATVDNDDLGNIAFETWVAQQLANLVASSPASLDTLNELAAALNNDPNFATTMIDALANKANRAGDTFTGNVYINGDSGPHVGVTRTGFPPAYLFSNSDYWGLYSDATGGEMLVGYQRATGKSYFANIDSALIVKNNGGTYDINVTGTASGLVGSNDYQMKSLGVGTPASGTAGDIRATGDIRGFFSSDKRLKENIVCIESALEIVEVLRGVRFDWTDAYIEENGGIDDYFLRKEDIGVIADDVEKVLPELVSIKNNGYKAVKYDRLVAVLIEAVKQLNVKSKQSDVAIAELKEMVVLLSKKITELENKMS